jgi:hypothetical protein
LQFLHFILKNCFSRNLDDVLEDCAGLLDEHFAEAGDNEGAADQIASLAAELILFPETYYAISELMVSVSNGAKREDRAEENEDEFGYDSSYPQQQDGAADSKLLISPDILQYLQK